MKEFSDWRSKQAVTKIKSFNSLFHPKYKIPMFDIRTAEIREDWGQRNALLDKARYSKILGLAKNFDPMMFEPISVDFIESEKAFIIRDGGGRAHAAIMNGIYSVPATVRKIENYEQSRALFINQDKYAQAIGQYDKFLQQLADENHSYHKVASDIFAISRSAKFSLHHSQKSTVTPLIEGLGVLKKTIKEYGGDLKDVQWGSRVAPNLVEAVDVLKAVFPTNEQIPVSVLTAVAAFIYVTKNRIPSGRAGRERIVDFFKRLVKSNVLLEDINKWVSVLKFDSSNNYGSYGCASFMREWNKVFKYANRGNKAQGFYKYVKFEDFEIEMVLNRPMTLARDASLFA
jgi:antitoxin component HigA of HigAB toxin-antitoxin module